jgi:hypothetical protein
MVEDVGRLLDRVVSAGGPNHFLHQLEPAPPQREVSHLIGIDLLPELERQQARELQQGDKPLLISDRA